MRHVLFVVGHCMIWVETVTLRRMGTMGAVRTPPASPSTLPSKMPCQVTDFFLLYQDMHAIRCRARGTIALFTAALYCHMCFTPALTSLAIANIILLIHSAFICRICCSEAGCYANTMKKPLELAYRRHGWPSHFLLVTLPVEPVCKGMYH